jgi:membrane-bound lytic murein transglycosylase D
MRFLAVALIFSGVTASLAQTPEVPHKMHFADMTLTIRDDARREIQKDVDALTKSPKYFGIKVERARMYFPFIEKVFAEERLPDDFKYLALQESALISDAVSVSNAVGFWQFKDFTAMEMGMRVDKQIDERMNIVSASRGAAKYLKQNNFMFNNWLFALQAYQMGAGGVKRMVGDEFNGVKHMEITSDTYWYVKKFIAHKVAFENAVNGDPLVKVQVYELKEKKQVSELASQLGVDEVYLKENNKWIRSGTIPDDRTYVLLVPGGKLSSDFNTLMVSSSPAVKVPSKTASDIGSTVKKEINGVMAIQALANESTSALASRAGLSVSEFLRFNDIKIDHSVINGEFYFTGKKKNKSGTLTHTLADGEDLWLVSQRYGVTLKRVKRLNRLTVDENLTLGEVVWLGAKKPVGKPADQPVEVLVAQTDSGEGEFFDWEVNPGAPAVIAKSKPASVDKELKDKKIPVNDVQIVANTTNSGTHVVEQGETLYAISKKYNVAVTELLEWNQLDITKGLKPGQELTTINPSDASVIQPQAELPESKAEQWFTYEVKTSDTLYSVARQYNVTIKEIMDWNDKSDFSLSQGEKLKILSR